LAALETHKLNLDHFDLCTFPNDVVKFELLTELSVHDNMLQIVPASIAGMVSLRVLALHGNRISAVPASTGKLTNLEVLNLASNLLQFLPADIGLCKNLVQLSLEDNPLIGPLQDLINRGTPDVLAYLNMLFEAQRTKELNLSFQGFRFFPVEAMYIDDLKTLFVNDNQIRVIPESLGPIMTALTVLNLSNNELATLPYTVGEMTALRKLSLSGNVLKNLPPTMGRITSLKELTVTNNLLEAPPADVVERGGAAILSYLRSFHVGNRTGILTIRYSVYLLYRYISTNTDTEGAVQSDESRKAAAGDGCQGTQFSWLYWYKRTHTDAGRGVKERITELDVSKNQLESLPEEIGLLVNCKIMLLDFNLLTTLPDSLPQVLTLLAVLVRRYKY
jgi:Leucine-rich repeat (LRR) protein